VSIFSARQRNLTALTRDCRRPTEGWAIRNPSPPATDDGQDDDFNNMTREELLGLVRRQNAQPPLIKSELKRDRDDTIATDGDDIGEAARDEHSQRPKRPRTEVEVLDLT